MDWNDLRYFLQVARTGSLTRTAAELGVSQSTVARRVQALEAALGATLFAHHQTGYFLTDEGRALVSRAEAVEEAALGLEADAASRGQGLTGTVRLATAENLASHVLIPALPVFRIRYPGIVLEIATGISAASLSRREADLALRLSRPEQGNLAVRRLGDQSYALYGSRQYLAQYKVPEDEGRFSGHSFVAWDEAYAHLPMAQWLQRAMVGASPVLVATSLQAHLSAAKAGLGLAVLLCFLANPEPDLVQVMPPEEVLTQEIWLVIHGDLAGSARVRAVADFLAELMHAERNWLLGRTAKRPRVG